MRVPRLILTVAAGAVLTVSSAWADGSNPCPAGAATTTAPAPATAQMPKQSNRQYSYQPGAQAAVSVPAPRAATSTAPRRYRSYSYAPTGNTGYRNYNRGFSFGQRDAGSKARGDYTPYRGGNYIP